MDAWREPPVETAPGYGWARRILRQQLDALSRLAAVAWRLANPQPSTPMAEPLSVTAVMAGVRGLEKALRLRARVFWARRLIGALRARLVAEMQALDNGQAPTPPVEEGSFTADPGSPTANAASASNDKVERGDRAERGDRPERDRFGFEGRGSDKQLAEILKRPTAEIIALICRELGLPEDWPQRAEEAWAREAADAAQDEGFRPRRALQRASPPSTTPAFSSS